MRLQLAEGQIKAEDGNSRGAERIRQCHEQRGVAVRSRAVRQDETIIAGNGRAVQVPANGYFIGRGDRHFAMAVHMHRLLQQNGCDLFSNSLFKGVWGKN
jgi:hypothetical protein